MKNLKEMILSSLIVLTLLEGCGIYKSYYKPYSKEIEKIRQLPYKENMFDCSNKSVMMYDFYKKKGIEANVISINIGSKKHAAVIITHPKTGIKYIIEPTIKGFEDGWELEDYPEYKSYSIYNEDDLWVERIQTKTYFKYLKERDKN